MHLQNMRFHFQSAGAHSPFLHDSQLNRLRQTQPPVGGGLGNQRLSLCQPKHAVHVNALSKVKYERPPYYETIYGPVIPSTETIFGSPADLSAI